ncbi:uncharacterized protein [Argopecten irradians]|uniref:uncharacterized protein n=1 Tax=Argopecten irradians TaxID=31199 RepID=UPI00371FE357
MSFKLPIVDLSKARTDREALAKVIVDALENTGFLFIDNIEGLDFDLWYQCCEWFFKQPEECKKKLLRNFWNPESKNVYRGYFPVLPNEPSRKEGFEFARDVPPNDPTVKPNNWFYENSVWPEEDGSFPFKANMRSLYEKLHETALEILRLTAIGLGIEEDIFTPLFSDKPCTTYRIMHYPPWEGSPPDNAKIEDGKVVITPEHTDTNFLTLLATFHYKGLEVKMPDGTWAEVDPRPKSLVMNIGDTFSRMMGGRLKATAHRVIDIGVDRYTSPFFFTPGYDADIGINFMSKATGQGPDHVFERYGPWVLNVIKHVKKYFEYRVLPDIE